MVLSATHAHDESRHVAQLRVVEDATVQESVVGRLTQIHQHRRASLRETEEDVDSCIARSDQRPLSLAIVSTHRLCVGVERLEFHVERVAQIVVQRLLLTRHVHLLDDVILRRQLLQHL